MKLLRITAFAFGLLALMLVKSSVSAQIIYNGGAPGYFGAFYADTGSPDYSTAGDVFTTSTDTTANTILFSGKYYSPQPNTTNSFEISLYSTSGGAPDSLLATSTLVNLNTQTDPNNSNYYTYQGDLSTPFVLSADTSYYVGISNTTTPYSNWGLAASNSGTGTEYSYYNVSNTFIQGPTGYTGSIELSSSPEPSSWTLLLGGLGLLACWRLRARRA